MPIATCHTDTCPNNGQGIEISATYVDENGDTQTVDGVACGACGQPITDVTESPAPTN
jgi:hypothetical protein